MPIKPDFNFKGIRDVALENTLKFGKKDFPYSGIWNFSGSQGSGKTLLLMHCLRQMITEFPNALVVSNISIFGIPCLPYQGIEDFEKYNNGADGIIFVVDEIHILFNALESKNMPLSTMQVWAQNRKNHRVIFTTSQRFNRIAKGIREQVTWNYECKRPVFDIFFPYRILDGSNYDDKGNYIIEDEKDIPKKHWYVPNVSVMRMYNTLEVVKRDKIKGEN